MPTLSSPLPLPSPTLLTPDTHTHLPIHPSPHLPPPPLLTAQEIKIEQREYIQGVAHEGWLMKQGGKFKNWKKRWVICSGSVLYYFESPKDPTPKGLVPLENIVVRTTADKPFAFALSSSDHEGGVIKSAKAKKEGGGMESGAHEKFIFAADSDGERMRWLHAIRENVKASEAKSRQDKASKSATPALPSAPSSGASFNTASPASTPRSACGGFSPRGSLSKVSSLRNSSIISSKMLSSCAKMPVGGISEEASVGAGASETSSKSPGAAEASTSAVAID